MINIALALSCLLLPTKAFDEYQISLSSHNDRTLDLADLGVNLTSTFNQLLSPAGIVNQYALSILLQIMFIVGYVLSGLLLAGLKARYTEGPIVEVLEYFDTHLSAQSIVDLIARSLLSLVWELISRIITTFMLFGIFDTVSEVLSSTSLLSIWGFLSSTQLKEIMLVNFVLSTIFVAAQYPLVTAAGPVVTDLLGSGLFL